MDSQQHYNTIEAYLAGELTGDALATFERQLQEDAKFATELESHEIAHDAIEILIEADLRKELNALREEATVVQMPAREAATAPQPRVAMLRSFFPRIAAAASVILLIGFFTFQYNQSNVLDGHYTEYLMPESNRSGNANETNPLAEGLEAYRLADYATAIDFYTSIPESNKRYNEAQFYLGHSYFKNKEYTKASDTFQKVAASGDLRYTEQAEWYQLLALLANNQQDTSFNNLLNSMLNDEKHSYHKKAKQLKADL